MHCFETAERIWNCNSRVEWTNFYEITWLRRTQRSAAGNFPSFAGFVAFLVLDLVTGLSLKAISLSFGLNFPPSLRICVFCPQCSALPSLTMHNVWRPGALYRRELRALPFPALPEGPQKTKYLSSQLMQSAHETTNSCHNDAMESSTHRHNFWIWKTMWGNHMWPALGNPEYARAHWLTGSEVGATSDHSSTSSYPCSPSDLWGLGIDGVLTSPLIKANCASSNTLALWAANL